MPEFQVVESKLDSRRFLADVRPLLTAEEAEGFDEKAGRKAFASVFTAFIRNFPGEPWANTPKMLERYGLADPV